MARTGRAYADDVRELRAAGFDFPASRGYLLADAANWSPGLKGAVTRAANNLQESIDFDDDVPEVTTDIGDEFFDDAAGDAEEEWDDIDYFSFDEAEDLIDAESDDYDETT